MKIKENQENICEVKNKKYYLESSSDLTRRLQCHLSTNYMRSYKSKSKKIIFFLLKHRYSTFTQTYYSMVKRGAYSYRAVLY